jgi:hypothetical protein
MCPEWCWFIANNVMCDALVIVINYFPIQKVQHPLNKGVLEFEVQIRYKYIVLGAKKSLFNEQAFACCGNPFLFS